MKVLRKGRAQKGWAKKYRCTGRGNGEGGCGATLLVEEGDLFETNSSALGEVTRYPTFECPCGVRTDIPWSDVPGHLYHLPERPRKT